MTDCKSKRAYKTWEEAVGGALAGSRKTHARLRIYTCPLCGKLHLTKQPKRGGSAPPREGVR